MQKDTPRYVIIVPDGMGDYPIPELGGKTPLQSAHIPNMDCLARKGMVGLVQTIPPDLPAGSDVANLSLLGFDPGAYYTGRAPLEAANIGVELSEGDVAYRCNLVTLRDGKMEDFSSGHISTAEAAELINLLNDKIGTKDIRFYPGTSYRHLMVWSGGESASLCTPPHDISGKEYTPHLPQGPGSDRLNELMAESQRFLPGHPVNKQRMSRGKPPATSIWLWGQGHRPNLPKFIDHFHIKGGIISAVDLLKGLGKYLGLTIINVPGITGYLDTNYAGKAEYALNALDDLDFIFIHIEAPDEAGHNGDYKAKVQSIEDIDRQIVGRIIEGLKFFPHHSILVLPDHLTPVQVKTHTREPVPFCLYSSWRRFTSMSRRIAEIQPEKHGHFFAHTTESADANTTEGAQFFDEKRAEGTGIYFNSGPELIHFFLKGM